MEERGWLMESSRKRLTVDRGRLMGKLTEDGGRLMGKLMEDGGWLMGKIFLITLTVDKNFKKTHL